MSILMHFAFGVDKKLFNKILNRVMSATVIWVVDLIAFRFMPRALSRN
jgi:hypothetical protein